MSKQAAPIIFMAVLLISSMTLGHTSSTKANEGSESKGSSTKVALEQKSAAKTSSGSERKNSTSKPAVTSAVSTSKVVAEQMTSSNSTLKVLESGIAAAIENRMPVEPTEKFDSMVKKLYCYTKIAGGKKGSQVTHRWKKGEEVMAEITLAVNASPWRTFSSKNIMPEWTGKWTVDVLEGDVVIAILSFVIEDMVATP